MDTNYKSISVDSELSNYTKFLNKFLRSREAQEVLENICSQNEDFNKRDLMVDFKYKFVEDPENYIRQKIIFNNQPNALYLISKLRGFKKFEAKRIMRKRTTPISRDEVLKVLMEFSHMRHCVNSFESDYLLHMQLDRIRKSLKEIEVLRRWCKHIERISFEFWRYQYDLSQILTEGFLKAFEQNKWWTGGADYNGYVETCKKYNSRDTEGPNYLIQPPL